MREPRALPAPGADSGEAARSGQAAPVHLGTSSWLFDAWKGPFYPEKMPSRDFLAYYVTQFDTVEVNTSFYALPRPTTLIDWADTAPPGFTYALKMPRRITHELKLQNAQSDMLLFIDAVRALGPAAAPALLQLPPDFTRRTFGRPLATFLDWLAPQLQGVRIAVEVRAADLMTPAFAAFLAERGMALAIVDRAHAPPVDLHALWLDALNVAGAPRFAFLRWIGDDVAWRDADGAIVNPRPDDLARWAQHLAQMARQGIEIFGYMHNPYEGHSPASLRTLKALLAAQGIATFEPGQTGQLTLF